MSWRNFFHLERQLSSNLDPDVRSSDQRARALKIVVLCCMWYTFSAFSNNITKSILGMFPMPQTVTAVQLMSVLFYIPIQMRIFGIKRQSVSRTILVTKLAPLAAMRVVGMIMSAVSILKVPLSYAHTVKAISPVCTVALSTILLREPPTLPILLSLMPIVAGIMLATVTEIHFDLIGMIAALTSTVLFAVQNIYSKKLMRQRTLDHMNLLYHSTRASFMLFFPFWAFTDGWDIIAPKNEAWYQNPDFSWWAVLWRFWIGGFCFFGQNITAFSVLFLVSPVSYSVANTTKRIVVITASLIVFGNEVSFWNVMGMSMAIGGVALYNKAKYEAARAKTHELPTSRKEAEASPFIEYGDNKVLTLTERKLSMQRTATPQSNSQQAPTISHMHFASSVTHTPSPYPRTPTPPVVGQGQHPGGYPGYPPYGQFASNPPMRM